MSSESSQKKPRAQRRRYCRKCNELHPTTGYQYSLWYCEPCAGSLDLGEVITYVKSREHKRAEINKSANNYLFTANKQFHQ